MNCDNIGPIGLCSWSLGNDLGLLGRLREKTGLNRLHLSVNPELDGQKNYLERFVDQRWQFSATMVGFLQEDYTTLETIRRTGGIVPDDVWPQNRQRVIDAIRLTRQLNVPYLEFHFGFIDQTDKSAFNRLVDKARQLADIAGQEKVTILMETGQETAETLRRFLETAAHPALAVNFDPGNMILYGKGNPVQAVGILSRWIRHVHAKDALPSPTPGQWGTEMAWTKGQVNTNAFLKALRQEGFQGTLAIEREASGGRLDDIELAIRALSEWNGGN